MAKQVVWNFEMQTEEQYHQFIEESVMPLLFHFHILFRCKGLVLVMEVYSTWAGSCKAIQANLRRVQFEQGEEKVKFAHVSAPTLASLVHLHLYSFFRLKRS
jgi:hypothetical protein